MLRPEIEQEADLIEECLKEKKNVHYKSPETAGFLSALIPGSGQSMKEPSYMQRKTVTTGRSSTRGYGSPPCARISRTTRAQMVRYYGWYSNVFRGKRQKKNTKDIIPSIIESDRSLTASWKSWKQVDL